MRKKTITISNLDGYEQEVKDKYLGTYVIEEWTFGQKEDVTELSSEQVKDKDGETTFKIKIGKFRINQMLACLVSAPKPINLDYIRGMPSRVGDKISAEITELVKELDEDSVEGKL